MQDSQSVSAILWHAAGLFCHQLPDRSPQFEGAIFPLCFRCAGLYLSVTASFAFLAVNRRWRRLPSTRGAVWLSALIVPLLVDGWGNATGLWSSDGWVRALTGVGVGLVLPVFLVPLAGKPGADTMEPGVANPLALLAPAATSLVLVWLVVHPMRRAVFTALAAGAACAPLIFATVFLLAGWRNRQEFSRALGVASHDVPC
jgi:uncharacterized membrane protein